MWLTPGSSKASKKDHNEEHKSKCHEELGLLLVLVSFVRFVSPPAFTRVQVALLVATITSIIYLQPNSNGLRRRIRYAPAYPRPQCGQDRFWWRSSYTSGQEWFSGQTLRRPNNFMLLPYRHAHTWALCVGRQVLHRQSFLELENPIPGLAHPLDIFREVPVPGGCTRRDFRGAYLAVVWLPSTISLGALGRINAR